MTNLPFDDDPAIDNYSRRQALDDGILLDLTDQAQEIGLLFLVACTGAVYHRYLLPEERLKASGQTLESRIHDLLVALRAAIEQSTTPTYRITFTARFMMPTGNTAAPTFISVCSPDDAGDPVITIMLLGEA